MKNTSFAFFEIDFILLEFWVNFRLKKPWVTIFIMIPFHVFKFRTILNIQYSIFLNNFRHICLFFVELNLSHNQVSKLPEELAELQELENLDISHNTFIALPTVVCRIPQLKRLHANNNSIIGKHLWTSLLIKEKIRTIIDHIKKKKKKTMTKTIMKVKITTITVRPIN